MGFQKKLGGEEQNKNCEISINQLEYITNNLSLVIMQTVKAQQTKNVF